MQLLTWVQALPLLLVVIGGLYLPGGLVTVLAGRRNIIELIALAPIVSLTIAGVDGIIFYPVGIHWNWATYIVSVLIVLGLILVVRIVAQNLQFKRAQTPAAQPADSNRLTTQAGSHSWHIRKYDRWLPALLGLALAAGSITVRLICAVPSPEQVSQNYDSVFHDNIVARIALTGQASSLHALPPVREVYPIAFQEFAALGMMGSGSSSATAAVTGTWLVFAALVWPLSMFYLVRTLAGAHPVTDFLSLALSAACAGFPFLLLDWGSLYSMFAGQVILPVLLALVWQWCLKDWRTPGKRWTGLVWIAIAICALSLCHFRVMMTAILLALPLLVVWLVTAGGWLYSHRKPIFGTLLGILTGGLGLLLALAARIFSKLYLSGSARPISDHLNGGPAQATESIPSALARYLLGQPIDSSNQRLPVVWIIVVLLACCLLIVLLEHRRQGIILLASFLLLGCVFVACAGSQADWAKIVTALWYKDQRRLFASWPIVAISIICWALGSVLACSAKDSQLTNLRFPQLRHPLNRLLLVSLALVTGIVGSIANPQMDAMQAAVKRTFTFAANDQDSPMLSKDEYLLLKRLDQQVNAQQSVLSDPWNGSGFMLAIGQRTPYYPHLYSLWDHDHDYLARNFANMRQDPEVCHILERNQLEWYLDMGGPYVANDPQHAVFSGLHPVPGAMTAVDRQGRATLYKITACKIQP